MSDVLIKVRPLQASHAYDLITRYLGALWFLVLADFMALGAYNEPRTLAAVGKSCLVIFYLMLWLLMVTRPLAKSQIQGFLPRLAAFVGTYMPWTIGFFPRSDSTLLILLSAICLISGMVLAIISVSFLGRAFSLIPQARKIVQSGPYYWLRHPLYTAEELAIFGTLLQFLSPVTVAIFMVHIAMQICRITYEERLLRQTFPAYDMYAATTWRLVPYVW